MKGLYYNDVMRALAATNVDLEPEISAAVEELALAAYKLAEACGDYGGVYLNATLSFFEPEDDDDPEPAPVEDQLVSPVERKFQVGDMPLVIAPKRERVGGTIIVAGYTIDDYVEDEQGNTYRESELEPAD